jgi:endo-1,3(4)-beta-glucanase
MPTDDEIAEALTELREGVEVWINGTGEAQYIYDSTWGGLVNCGCTFIIEDTEHPDKGYCNNTFPDCPVLTDVNVDFGNGFYNDHHFHYGYHVYAAAVVAKFDPAWGRTFFDRVMLYIRDYANPSADDPYFPQFRQKDWFLGSSWASGFISANTPHGRNQESSSESIAAYEGMALFGDAMMDAFRADSKTKRREKDAKQVRDAGRLLTAMEVKATQRYYHVWNSTKHVNTYPPQYKQPVVAMLYETMASFQTWFAGGDMVSIGIQLLPFTPVSERRDNPEWASLAYKPFEKSCYSDKDFCIKNGWSILLCGLKATIGDREEARKEALTIPEKVFLSDGGDGHSRSNLIWYVATRPDVNLTQSTEEDSTSTVD